VSNTDLVNSGSYFTVLLVVVFGITTFVGFGGSFLITGLAVGFIETRDLGSFGFGFFIGAGGAGGGAAGFASTFLAATGAALFATGLTAFGATGLAAFLTTGFEGLAALAAGFAVFLATGLGVFLAAGFFGAGFFLLAILSGFF
jgi:hypothetical protein